MKRGKGERQSLSGVSEKDWEVSLYGPDNILCDGLPRVSEMSQL